MKKYRNEVLKIIDEVFDTQIENMEKASNLLVKAVENKNSIFIFGSSHAGILSEEAFYRAGGFALINPLFSPNLMLNVKPITFTSDLEQLEGYGRIFFKTFDLKKNDVLIIHSVSGRNPVSIEIAEEADKIGVKIIVITNIKYSKSVTSRHQNEKKLYEFGSIIIDNCGEIGDAAVKLDGLEQRVAPTSTVIGVMILNSIIVDVTEKLLEKGMDAPIFFSANRDGGREHNEKIFEKYKDLIHYM
ncbi:MAG: SIS domain-containing protein [Sebaldella sp.]|nr:SIS domain-containing protein [Sebaldella sp.]